jgi:bifunctional non-homologous end joining protein LigD
VDGAAGESFYQRDWHDEPPEFVRLAPIWAATAGRDIHAVICDNLPTLLWLANTADIEMHAWYARVSNDGGPWPEDGSGSEDAAEACALNYPDYIVFDLDPWIKAAKEAATAKEAREQRLAALAACKEVAAMVRERLEKKGLRAYIKTSGKTGLHILAPIERRYRFEETREVARRLGADLAAEHPDEVSIEWRIAKRKGHVFVDHMQNVRAKTLPAPYSLRATDVASVSMPLRWEELAAADSFDFTLRTVPAILRERGDAWAGMLDHRAPLTE